MKTRSSFVSNSSSSSFIIPLNNGLYPTVADIALDMIPKRGWDDDDEVALRIHRQLELGMSPNHPIAFSSCNYDTYIKQTNNGFLVSTCNNHDWDFEIGGMAQDDDQEHYILYEMPYDTKYYNASFGITGWRYSQMDRDGYRSHEFCKECRGELWVCDGGAPFCPNCGTKKITVDPFETWWDRQMVISEAAMKAVGIPADPFIKTACKMIAQGAWDAAKKDRS